MKCQNCGKNEVNLHYTSNINGAVTETHLCAECAQNSGYDLSNMFSTSNIFDEIFPSFAQPFGLQSLMQGGPNRMRAPSPMQTPMTLFGMSPMFPFAMYPLMRVLPYVRTGTQPEAGLGAAPGTQTDTADGGHEENCSCSGACETGHGEQEQAEGVDAEINRRREINAMREQMRIAAAKEDFEKAAELRDKIQGMESV